MKGWTRGIVEDGIGIDIECRCYINPRADVDGAENRNVEQCLSLLFRRKDYPRDEEESEPEKPSESYRVAESVCGNHSRDIHRVEDILMYRSCREDYKHQFCCMIEVTPRIESGCNRDCKSRTDMIRGEDEAIASDI